MGEVYRAKDTKLEREVAIKVLPAALAQDPVRLARFEREAKVLASLNHPNIATIYGVEESDGVRALAMELVPGERLKGPLPLQTALNYAKQIAEALEAAHEKGIVHRDLKPANIMVTPEGVVKLLDFGLAAVPTRDVDGSVDRHNSPTMTIAATQAGMIMGTAAYMSPEQAAGKPVDKRADIWSFGVVLWEMITGRQLFDGETISHTLAAVLTKEPDLGQAPVKVRRLLQSCLQKDTTQRLQAIGDWRLLLTEETPHEPVHAVPSRLPWVVSAILGAALAGLAFFHFRETPPPAPVVNSTLLPPMGTEFSFIAAWPVVSPDGTRLVFGAKAKVGKAQLWLRRLDSPSAQPLPGTEDAIFPFWSPDSRWIAFGQDRKLKKIDTQGGPPVQVTDLEGPLRGGSWSPKGVIVFGANGGNMHGILRVAEAGGMATQATTPEKGELRNHVFPWFLPDGRHFLYTRQQGGDLPVRVGSLDEPEKPGKVVAQTNSTVVYAQGYLLYLRERTLMAQPFDPGRLETTGEAVPLAQGVPTFMQPSRPAVFSVSASGLLVYQSEPGGSKSTILWKDREGKTLSTLGESVGQVFEMALSPDGKRLAARIRDHASNEDIWIYDTARGIPTRFTFDPAIDRYPVWSADGSTIYFASDRRGSYDLFRKASSGASGEELLLVDSIGNKRPESVSPDGKLLLYTAQNAKTLADLWVLPLAQAQPGGKAEPRVFLRTPFNESWGQFSPDGHWVAYESDESGQNEVYVAPFPGPGGKFQISSGGAGFGLRWRRDGKELFYLTADRQLMAAEVAIGNGTLEVKRVQKLLGGVNTGYDVSSDGQKFVVPDDSIASSPPLTLLQNWPAALRK
jgi:serine/threonine protein kinase/roadblock/LC7 domain-containing protein